MAELKLPYSFVPCSDMLYIPEWAHEVSHDIPFKDSFSGSIDITLTNRGYLCVGAQSQQSDDKQYSAVGWATDDDDRLVIPGSSIKGMLRTVLLAGELQSAQGKYRSSASAVIRNAGASGVRRDRYLKNEVSDIENTAFHTLHRKDERGKEIQLKNAVNDCLSGLVVSDSDPIEPSNLILCQKM